MPDPSVRPRLAQPAVRRVATALAAGFSAGLAGLFAAPAALVAGSAALGGFLAWRAIGQMDSGGGSFGDDGSPEGAAAQIESARFAKNELRRKIFAPGREVPWWLVGVGIGGSEGAWYVLVSLSGAPTSTQELRQWVPASIQGVPVVADASGQPSLEMSTS